jgi:hypothetical protein
MSPSADRVIHGGKHRTAAAEHRGPAVPTEYGVQKERSPASRTHALETGQIRLRMHRQQRLSRRGLGLSDLDLWLAAQPLENSAQPVWSLGMAGTGVVLEAARVGEDRDGHSEK